MNTDTSYLDMTIGVIGGLAVFLYGMKIMSDGLQKVAGEKMKSVLAAMTTNKYAGVGTGVVVTSVIQSSSATTVMLVGFVNAGLMTLDQSIGVIMGANIGTTATAWLVSLFGFKVKISAMALPAIAVGIIPRFIGNKKLTDWGEVLIGFGILFIGLGFMKDAVSILRNAPEIKDWIANHCYADTIGSRMIPVFVGMVFTFIVQSSSAAMAVTMTMAAQNLISIETACALALGQNIGTTITANLASIGTSIAARQAACAHFLFNFLGSIWPVLLFYPFLNLVGLVAPDALNIDFSVVENIKDPEKAAAMNKSIAFSITVFLAVFHTFFNVINTLLFLPLSKHLAWLSTKLIWGKTDGEEIHLKFLNPKVINSAPMALHAARGEVGRMLEEVQTMFSKTIDLITHPDEKMGKVAKEIQSSEQVVDMLEKEITEFLVPLAKMELSDEQSHDVAGIFHSVSDIERMGDHCEALLRLAKRRYDQKIPFDTKTINDITSISDQVSNFLSLLHRNLRTPMEDLMVQARQLEDTIDEMRKRIRQGYVDRIKTNECGVHQGLIYIDMLTSFEKIGDHAFNVAQFLSGER